MNQSDSALHQGTPGVSVLDNRGHVIRELRYYRHPDTPQEIAERIAFHQFDRYGFISQSLDPRLAERRKMDSSVKPNLSYFTTLSGEVLRTDGVDAGTIFSLNDIAARPAISISATGVSHTWQYEGANRSGRVLSRSEREKDREERIIERFYWAGSDVSQKANNLAGQCLRHYNSAGLNQTLSIALTGTPLSASYQPMLESAEPDWQGTNESAWLDLLTSEIFTTYNRADANGETLVHTDAMGNTQRLAYDVAGFLKSSWLSLKGGQERIIVKSLTYSAAGQKLQEEHGNGVLTTYSYEAETQRLIGIRTERPAGHLSGAKVFQDLRYTYDPVGNVLRITNDAEATRFWRNQKVVPENTYIYDSLYQLVGACGREMANIPQQGSQLPTLSPIDDNAYTNYIRNYRYDSAGNLMQIRHTSAATNNSYTTNITVSKYSNRAVLSSLTDDADKVEGFFDAAGRQNQLLPGQTLSWNARGELAKVTPVARDGQESDSETYRYDANSQRVSKMAIQQSNNNTQTRRVLYLAGLERRTIHQGNTLFETLLVVKMGEAGRAQVQVMHWELGKPTEVANDELRYSYDNLIGSSGLEVDGTGQLISQEEYYPYGGTAVWMARSQREASDKAYGYSGKERDATGLYYYGFRYYQPWVGRWLSADPAGTIDGLNLFRMVRNNPIVLHDPDGLAPSLFERISSFRKKDTLTISSLKGTGPFYTRAESEIDIDFLFSRQDRDKDFPPQNHKGLSAEDRREVLEVSSGENITSANKSAKWYAGIHWETKPLKNNTDLVVLHNGVQGAAGININLNDIKPGRSVLVTAGTLTGCTMITGVKGNNFYALHAGTGTPSENWLTGEHGVTDNFRLLNKLIPDAGIALNPEAANDSLLTILDYFDKGTIAYNGKKGSEIHRDADNILNYRTEGYANTVGVSFSLLTKNKNGEVSASTLLELGELKPHKKHRTRGEFGMTELKYEARKNTAVKLR